MKDGDRLLASSLIFDQKLEQPTTKNQFDEYS